LTATANMETTSMNFFLSLALITAVPIVADASLSKEEMLNLLSQERYFPYQDVTINNEVLARGVGPDCSSRYDAIKAVLAKYRRPIKVLDIGASNGYFSLRIAYDFDALCVMADVSDRLCNICKLNDQINGIVYLKRALSLEDLKALNALEHFDVVLALNVVHHMSPYKEILDLIFELGDTIIIETPPANDTRAEENPDVPLIEQYLLDKQNGIVIAQTPRAAANNFEEITSLIDTANHLVQKEYIPGAYAKMFCFENIVPSDLMPTFKTATYNLLNGVFPVVNNDIERINVLSIHM
jgi:SAM-dependent methyltransferase